LKENSIVKSSRLSFLLRIIFWSFFAALIILILYVYHEGVWKEILNYYRVFFNPRRLEAFIASFGTYAAIVFVLVQVAQVVFSPIPGEVTGFVGGPLFGKTSGVILSTIGLTLGSMLAFFLSRTFGLKLVEKVVKQKYIESFNFFVTHKGLYISFALFLIPGFPKDSLCYLLGLTHMRWIDFILMNLFGRLPGTLILTLQGYAVKNGRYQAFFNLIILTVILIIVLYLSRNYIVRFVGYIIHGVLRKKNYDKGNGNSIAGKDLK